MKIGFVLLTFLFLFPFVSLQAQIIGKCIEDLAGEDPKLDLPALLRSSRTDEEKVAGLTSELRRGCVSFVVDSIASTVLRSFRRAQNRTPSDSNGPSAEQFLERLKEVQRFPVKILWATSGPERRIIELSFRNVAGRYYLPL
jgi:hypothetical protein